MAERAADLVLSNGKVWCGHDDGVATAVAVADGRVLASGSDAAMAELVGPGTRVIDLEGRLATPGLNDSHMHLLPLGLAMAEVDVRPKMAPTLATLLRKIKDAADARPKGQWILARGYDHFALDVRRHPTIQELDAVAPAHPVYLVRACGHLSVVNSTAARLARIDAGTRSPPGGLIEVRDGKLTGLLAEHGRDPVKAVLPDPTDEELVRAIERAGRYCLSMGVTSVMDAAVGMRAGYREIGAYERAKRDSRLPVRTYQCLLGGADGIVEEAFQAGLVTGKGDELLRVGPVKLFLDGSAGGKTAAMTSPYLGAPETKGIMCMPDAEVSELVERYHRRGYQMAIHAIGDAAIEQILVAYERALAAHPVADHRHRIEHCGYPTEAQTQRMRRAGIEPAPQPVFIRDFGDLYVSVLGEARAFAGYPLRQWIELGFKPAAGTDSPVCDVDTLANFHAMLTRRTKAGTVIGAEERIGIDRAIQAYTEFGAYLERAETQKGRLVAGQLADIAVFSDDLTSLEPDELLEARCDLTIQGGRVVYER